MAEWIFCKGKVYPSTGNEGPQGEWRYSSTLPLTSALDCGQRHAPAAFWKDPVPNVQGLSGPQGRSGRVRKISPAPEFIPRSRYTDGAIQWGPVWVQITGSTLRSGQTNPGWVLDREGDCCLAQESKSRLGPPSLLFSAYRLLCPHEWSGQSAKLTFSSSIVIRLGGATAALCCCTLEGGKAVSFTPRSLYPRSESRDTHCIGG